MKRLIIDVREPYEYESGHVEGAINIPPSKLLEGASELDNIEIAKKMTNWRAAEMRIKINADVEKAIFIRVYFLESWNTGIVE